MKVVHSISGIGLESSGVTYAVLGYCNALKAVGVDVELHARSNGGEVFPFKFQSYPYLWSWVLPGANRPMLKGLVRAAKSADIVHTNGLWNMPSVYPLWAAREAGCKLVVSPHGTLAPWALRKSWLKKKLFGYLYQNAVLKHADMLHATCEKEYNEIRAAGYKQPVVILPLGLDMPSFNVQPTTNNQQPATKTLAFFGRVHRVKAIDKMLIAWGKIAGRFTDWRVVIAGPDCGDKGRLEGIIAEGGIPRVEFVGELNGQAKYDFLATCDLYCLPSQTENFGVTLAEALACGVPSVASKGTPWAGLEREKCGRWVENDPEELASAFEGIMSLSDEERRQMGESGREWIRRDFSWESIGVKMKKAYEWLLCTESVERPNWIVY